MWKEQARNLRPMLATLADAPLKDAELVYELKYDGIRALIDIQPRPTQPVHVTIWSRLGNEKTTQFPEIAAAVRRLGDKVGRPLLLDGEIVALDSHGQPAGFQQLQGRINLRDQPQETITAEKAGAAAFIAFDLLRDGDRDLRPLSLTERRARLEQLFRSVRITSGKPGTIRLSKQVQGDGEALFQEAVAKNLEGLIAKLASSPYQTGRRSPAWKKLKLTRRQEFVIGGWTEPRQTREFFGALLLGIFQDNHLVYVGHTGSGFNRAELTRVAALLKRYETTVCPFVAKPRTNERPHWIQPKLVAEVKFTEWTADDKLRHPIYLGLRDDVDPKTVRREPTVSQPAVPADSPSFKQRTVGTSYRAQSSTRPSGSNAPRGVQVTSIEIKALIDQLDDIESRGGSGFLELPDGHRLEVTNLNKVFWPSGRITKGELMRYYVRVAPFILPAIADRPLVMKRLPNGIKSPAFYQHRVPDRVPPGVRVEAVADDPNVPRRLIGGSLITLLYMTQLASISQDPWFSRVRSSYSADFAALDLDPMPGVKFARVLDVARWVRDELHAFGAPGLPKTSGASGLHIYVPLPPQTPYEAGMLFCQIVATLVAEKHLKVATVRRAVRARGGTVYVDYLQNIRGKTLATAYSARASDFAGASTPLRWSEIDQGINPKDFTIHTLPERLAKIGDLWASLRTGKTVDLQAVLETARVR